jgi:hypothetical protein
MTALMHYPARVAVDVFAMNSTIPPLRTTVPRALIELQLRSPDWG